MVHDHVVSVAVVDRFVILVAEKVVVVVIENDVVLDFVGGVWCSSLATKTKKIQ